MARGAPSEVEWTEAKAALGVVDGVRGICERLSCPRRTETAMLRHAGLTYADWNRYVLELYGASSADLPRLPRIVDVDMVYTSMLDFTGTIEPASYDVCPRTADGVTPSRLLQPHLRVAAFYALAAPPQPAPSHSWVEVTHCGSHIEEEPRPGSGTALADTRSPQHHSTEGPQRCSRRCSQPADTTCVGHRLP